MDDRRSTAVSIGNGTRSPSMIKKRQHVTLKEIARELDLAPSTVSMALNNHPMIKEETRRLVQDFARRVNYFPNLAARAMVKGKTSLVGLLISNIQSSFFPEIIQGIEDVLADEGYSVILCPTNDVSERERYYMNLVRQKGVDGIISENPPDSPNCEEWARLAAEKPVVFILRRPKVPGAVSLVVNNRLGAQMATRHLIALGHRRIAHMAGPQLLDISQNRLEGYLAAMSEVGLSAHEDLIFAAPDFAYETGYRAMARFLDHVTPPTAVFCASDITALGGIHCARERGLKVPEDISFVGFDDLPIAAIAEVPLTTIAQPKEQLGRMAAEKLIRMIEGNKTIGKTLTPTLIERASTAPPRP
ncbi:MAG: LacI family DNA-binding transcriptional regulator [Candidatus Sumerlaeia bacterium]